MRYRFWLPLSALCVLALLALLVDLQILPPGLQLLESLKSNFDHYFYFLIAFIILLESIVYIGFYFPGQFFAVVLVVMAKPQWQDILYLTVAMVVAATLGSLINFCLGRWLSRESNRVASLNIKSLLVAMLHINSLAFFMFSQGANRQTIKVVFLAAILNLPYYLVLIIATSLLSEQVLLLAENTWILAGFIIIWLAITVYIDVKAHRRSKVG
jgi:membrane-associated protein